jgi:hypothetical protein
VEKFQANWSNSAKAELDKKIHEAYIRQNEEMGATLEQRRTARERLAAETKEYQRK